MGHICRGLPLHEMPSNAPRNHPSVPGSSGSLLPPLPTWGNGHSGLGFGIDSLLLQPEAVDRALGSHGWVHPEACVYPRAVLDPEVPCLRSCMGSRSSWSSLPGCPVPAVVPAVGSRVPWFV